MIRVGIVGHRYLNPGSEAFVSEQCLRILKDFLSTYKEVVALSAIAEGADSVFAECAISLDIPLEIVRPFSEYPADFSSSESSSRYQQLKRSASKETTLDHIERSDDAYYEGMVWVLINSDVIIAVWDGNTSGGRGGTSHAVRKLNEDKREWIHVDPVLEKVTSHLENWKLQLLAESKALRKKT